MYFLKKKIKYTSYIKFMVSCAFFIIKNLLMHDVFS